jgi:excisionase family DNA binding protein
LSSVDVGEEVSAKKVNGVRKRAREVRERGAQLRKGKSNTGIRQQSLPSQCTVKSNKEITDRLLVGGLPAEGCLRRGGGERMAEKLMTTEQVAEYLNVDKFTVYRLLDRKRLPAFKVGNQWRFQKKMIDAWLLRNSNIRRKLTN